MPFYFPRRHRRLLLLPPGLLALAGLLLLGCLALRPWQERLKRRSVVQLTMPIRPQPDDSKLTINNFLPNPDTLRKHYSWHNAHLTGNIQQDGWKQQQIISVLHRIAEDTLHGGILSVQLGPKARYSNMIFLLNLMLRENVKYYWLDITRHPTTFYALHKADNPTKPIPVFSCGTNDRLIRLPIPKQSNLGVHFDNWVTDFWQFRWLEQLLLPLQQPGWRGPLALLALLFLLNGRRLWLQQVHAAKLWRRSRTRTSSPSAEFFGRGRSK